jgi:hypothetical protein
MKNCRRFCALFCSVLAGLVVASFPVAAHHSEGNRYSQGQPILWQGTIQRVSWDGAHVMYLVSVADRDGSRRNWQVLGGSPMRLRTRGIHQHSLGKGETVTVAGYLNVASKIVTPVYVSPGDGRKMFVGYAESDYAFRPQAAITEPL